MNKLGDIDTMLAVRPVVIREETVRKMKGPRQINGEYWFRLYASPLDITWIKSHDGTWWDEIVDARGYIYTSIIDVNERLFMLVSLKYTVK